MTISDWRQFRTSLTIRPVYGVGPVSLPSAAQLNAAAVRLGHPLPASYREFLLLFGPGELASRIQIFSPECLENPWWDMRNQSKTFPAHEYVSQVQAEHRDMLTKAVVFATVFGYVPVVWIPADVQNSADSEYTIYDFSGVRHQGQLVSPAATSFRGYVESVCASQFAETPETGDGFGSRRTWEPAGVPYPVLPG